MLNLGGKAIRKSHRVPPQAAICTVRTYPYAADLPAIVEEVALQGSERSAADLLSSDL